MENLNLYFQFCKYVEHLVFARNPVEFYGHRDEYSEVPDLGAKQSSADLNTLCFYTYCVSGDLHFLFIL